MASFARTGRSIIAIGRNFAEHAKELNNAVPTEPFYFLKPTSSYLPNGGKVEIPRGTIVHHEVELGIVIGEGGRDISEAQADKHVAGYTLAIDMTARNIQDKVKKQGLPWSSAKGFDTFTPVSSFIPKSSIKDTSNVNLWLKVNGEFKQNGNTKDMIFDVPRLIKHVSSIMTLQPGDVILTGTPSGVGPIKAGDKITAGVADPSAPDSPIASLELDVVSRDAGYEFKA